MNHDEEQPKRYGCEAGVDHPEFITLAGAPLLWSAVGMSGPGVSGVRRCDQCGRSVTRAQAQFCPNCGAQLPNGLGTSPSFEPGTPSPRSEQTTSLPAEATQEQGSSQGSPREPERSERGDSQPEKQPPTPGEIVIMAAGAVMFVFSFLPFYSVSGGGQSFEWSSWSNAYSLLPLVPLMVLLGGAMAIRVALQRFGTLQVPERVTIYTWGQFETLLSVLIAVTIFCYLIRDLSGVGKGVGAWFLFLGSVGLIVGQILVQRDRATTSSAG